MKLIKGMIIVKEGRRIDLHRAIFHARLETLRVAGNKGRGAQPYRIWLSGCHISVPEIVSAIQKPDISWHFEASQKSGLQVNRNNWERRSRVACTSAQMTSNRYRYERA